MKLEMGIFPKVTFMGSIAKYGGKHSISMLHATGNIIVFPK